MIFIPEVIGRVIDTLRKEGNYTNWTKNGTTYTIDSPNELTENEWILILDTSQKFGFDYQYPIIFSDDVPGLIKNDPVVFGQFQVTNVNDNSFDIVSDVDPPLVGGWKSQEPFYIFGHRLEISNRLLMKDKDEVFKYQKYPLFALRLPIIEDVEDDVHDAALNIAILEFTDKNYRALERYRNVINPILNPLYFSFLEALQNTSLTMDNGQPAHQKVDRLFYGIEALEGNQSYIFNDPLDAIELINLNLKLIENNC